MTCSTRLGGCAEHRAPTIYTLDSYRKRRSSGVPRDSALAEPPLPWSLNRTLWHMRSDTPWGAVTPRADSLGILTLGIRNTRPRQEVLASMGTTLRQIRLWT